MPGKLERIVFSETTAAIFIKKTTKGTRSAKQHATRGRSGTTKISLWREIIGMIGDKGLAVSAALFFLAASEILSRFESQETSDLDRIRACIEKNELPSFALVPSICPGELLSFVDSAIFLLISWLCSCARTANKFKRNRQEKNRRLVLFSVSQLAVLFQRF
jgi:hypothetical protein